MINLEDIIDIEEQTKRNNEAMRKTLDFIMEDSMKSVLMSIKPQWCELIASGKKTIEVRKTRPKIEKVGDKFKCYIYMTKDIRFNTFHSFNAGKVIGEYVCNKITHYPFENYNDGEHLIPFGDLEKTCLDGFQIYDYLGTKDGYGWHISDLKIYDEPKELREFCFTNSVKGRWDKNGCRNMVVRKPPQSWCYVEEVSK